jgi:hypothetical protein
VTFSSIPTTTYKHLELRMSFANTLAYQSNSSFGIRFNGDTSTNYAGHFMNGNNTGVTGSNYSTQNTIYFEYGFGQLPQASPPAIYNIVDAFSSAKNKTVIGTTGYAETTNGQSNRMISGLWLNTAAITSVTVFELNANNWATRARFSLYGIKG